MGDFYKIAIIIITIVMGLGALNAHMVDQKKKMLEARKQKIKIERQQLEQANSKKSKKVKVAKKIEPQIELEEIEEDLKREAEVKPKKLEEKKPEKVDVKVQKDVQKPKQESKKLPQKQAKKQEGPKQPQGDTISKKPLIPIVDKSEVIEYTTRIQGCQAHGGNQLVIPCHGHLDFFGSCKSYGVIIDIKDSRLIGSRKIYDSVLDKMVEDAGPQEGFDRMSFAEAEKICAMKGMRVPTTPELYHIWKAKEDGCKQVVIDPTVYWSKDNAKGYVASYCDMRSGKCRKMDKLNDRSEYKVRCVKDME